MVFQSPQGLDGKVGDLLSVEHVGTPPSSLHITVGLASYRDQEDQLIITHLGDMNCGCSNSTSHKYTPTGPLTIKPIIHPT